VSAELWRRTGGFDEGYFMYWEDVDFGYRALGVGARVTLREDLVAVHDQGGTQGPRHGRAKSSLYYFYNCRNRLLFGERHLGRADLLRWLVLTPRVSWEVLLRGGRRQLLAQPRLAWSAASGGLAGMWAAARDLARLTGSR
jgi:GT2 family glycosyltransferase